LPHVGLERGRFVLRKQAFDLEEAAERSVARGDRAGRVFGHREARDDLEVPGRRVERHEPREAQIPDGQRILPHGVVGLSGLQIPELGAFLLLCPGGPAAEQQRQHRDPAPDSANGSACPTLFRH
jgi:hypothetical protein